MITKHFFKTLIIFVGIIAFGLVGVMIVGYFDQKKDSNLPTANPVLK